jgi:hypothetical protein
MNAISFSQVDHSGTVTGPEGEEGGASREIGKGAEYAH